MRQKKNNHYNSLLHLQRKKKGGRERERERKGEREERGREVCFWIVYAGERHVQVWSRSPFPWAAGEPTSLWDKPINSRKHYWKDNNMMICDQAISTAERRARHSCSADGEKVPGLPHLKETVTRTNVDRLWDAWQPPLSSPCIYPSLKRWGAKGLWN